MKNNCFFVNLLLFSLIPLDPSSSFSSSSILPFSNLPIHYGHTPLLAPRSNPVRNHAPYKAVQGHLLCLGLCGTVFSGGNSAGKQGRIPLCIRSTQQCIIKLFMIRA